MKRSIVLLLVFLLKLTFCEADPCTPRCETFEEINTLWSHQDPNKFWHCDNVDEADFIPVLRICAPETLFSFFHQTCVDPDLWEDACNGQEAGDGDDTNKEDDDDGISTDYPIEEDNGNEDGGSGDDGNDDDNNDDSGNVDDGNEDNGNEEDEKEDDSNEDGGNGDGGNDDDDVPDPDDDDNGLCPEPSCTTFTEINTLWAVPDPNFFLQCRPSPLYRVWVLQQMPCAPGTWFHFGIQVCVFPEDWRPCGGQLSLDHQPSNNITASDAYHQPISCPCPAAKSSDAIRIECLICDKKTAPKKVKCGVPRCRTDWERRVLWPGSAGDSFYQCIPDGSLVAKTAGFYCRTGSWFDWVQQRCVFKSDGVTVCPKQIV